jgi:hypothetical protein
LEKVAEPNKVDAATSPRVGSNILDLMGVITQEV